MPPIGPFEPMYCSLTDLRDEGVPDPPDDTRLTKLIKRASLYVDMFTQRWFEPRDMDFLLDGTGVRSIHLDQPIIEVTTLEIEESNLDLLSINVYNRHISQGLLEPDDRENPRLEIEQPESDDFIFKFGLTRFPRGQQNVRVVGKFGYTDPDGTAVGKTPDLICEATKLLTLREIPKKFSDADDAEDMNKFIVEHKTRDQTIKFAKPSELGAAGATPFTGDRRIDLILMKYHLPSRIRSV